jgi:glycosyltransferase involved in cell wall biosynthesis
VGCQIPKARKTAMKLLWFTWKDLSHPQAGGAERVNEEIAKRLARDGHEVIMLVAGFPGAGEEEIRNGYKIVRLGNRYTVYWHAYRYYKNYLQGWADLVIDEMNTIPFFCKYYVTERNILFVYQLCREIWFYQMPYPVNIAGYLFEPLYLRLLSDRDVITISESTRRDLARYGFNTNNIQIISVGITLNPVEHLAQLSKFPDPTLLSLGAIRPMKRTVDQIKAFEIAKRKIPDLKLIIAGTAVGRYGQKVLGLIRSSPNAKDIQYAGAVSEEEKARLMAKSHLLLVTSIKEGWGLVVTEANSQGTPAIVYDVDGLRDSVRNKQTGHVTQKNTPNLLADAVLLSYSNTQAYENLRSQAHSWSRKINFNQCYTDFLMVIKSHNLHIAKCNS